MILPHDSIAAQSMLERFCAANGVEAPPVEYRPNRVMVRINSKGYYDPMSQSIVVNAMHCPVITVHSTNPRRWTWPGYTADLTVLGVTAHELGHYFNHVRGWRSVLRKWHTMAMSDLREAPVTGYALKNPGEDLAEAFKVFVTDPSLLREVAPNRFKFLVEELGLVAIEERHWREILEDSPRHIRAVENRL